MKDLPDDLFAKVMSLVSSVEYATARECHGDGSLAVKRRKSVKANAANLLKAIGYSASEEKLCEIAGLPKPEAPDPAKPWPGARIVSLFSLFAGPNPLYRFPMAAVRKRPGRDEYEAVQGWEEFGHGGGSVSQGYRWNVLVGVAPTKEEAEAKLREGVSGKLSLRPHGAK